MTDRSRQNNCKVRPKVQLEPIKPIKTRARTRYQPFDPNGSLPTMPSSNFLSNPPLHRSHRPEQRTRAPSLPSPYLASTKLMTWRSSQSTRSVHFWICAFSTSFRPAPVSYFCTIRRAVIMTRSMRSSRNFLWRGCSFCQLREEDLGYLGRCRWR
jgi:hypothetical protein